MRYALHFVVVAVIVIALSFACNAASMAAWRAFPTTFATLGVSSLPFYAAWAAICAGFTFAYPDAAATPWRVPRWSRRDWVVFALVVVASVLMYLPPIVRAIDGQAHVPDPPLYIAAGGIVGPIVEEWLFRGIVWNVLRRAAPGRAGLVTAIVGGALLFGFWHLPFDGVTWFGVQLAFMHAGFGLLMGIARWRLDSVLPGTILHVLGNCLFVITH
ncbi:MAG TPA: CPBP family intramembrane glutamic endopeptidase [Kofleriaceae bacterium]